MRMARASYEFGIGKGGLENKTADGESRSASGEESLRMGV